MSLSTHTAPASLPLEISQSQAYVKRTWFLLVSWLTIAYWELSHPLRSSPIGGNEDRNLSVNLMIFATNRDLNKLMENGLFREDLYYRLNPPPFIIPPLRNRKDEIIALAEHFLKASNSNLTISEDAKQFLIEQPWEGNVRQLKDTIIKAEAICTSKELKIIDIKRYLPNEVHKKNDDPFPSNNNRKEDVITPENIVMGKFEWDEIKKVPPYSKRSALMIVAKSMFKGNQSELADRLMTKPNNLERFFSTLRNKVIQGEVDIKRLESHIQSEHHHFLETFINETLRSAKA